LIVLTILSWVLVGIFSLILLILLLTLPAVRLHVSAINGDFKITAWYLCFFYRVYPMKVRPEKPAKLKKKPKAEPEEKKDEDKPPDKEKPSIAKLFKRYKAFGVKAIKILRQLSKRLVVYKISVKVKIGGQDAHQTALRYAKATSFTAILIQLFDRLVTLKKPGVEVLPDFLQEQNDYAISFRLRFRPIFGVIAGIQLLAAWISSKRHKKPRRKGGKKYEPAKSYQ